MLASMISVYQKLKKGASEEAGLSTPILPSPTASPSSPWLGGVVTSTIVSIQVAEPI